MTIVQEIHASNEAYVRNWTQGQLPLPPARKVAIVTVSLLFSFPTFVLSYACSLQTT